MPTPWINGLWVNQRLRLVWRRLLLPNPSRLNHQVFNLQQVIAVNLPVCSLPFACPFLPLLLLCNQSGTPWELWYQLSWSVIYWVGYSVFWPTTMHRDSIELGRICRSAHRQVRPSIFLSRWWMTMKLQHLQQQQVTPLESFIQPSATFRSSL